MYLPAELLSARVLITVKTYPLPSSKYDELVCTAGLLEDGKWIRIYPIPFRSLSYEKQYKKYTWIELDLIRNTSDFRPESYKPRRMADEAIKVMTRVNTDNNWAQRKSYVFKEVFTSLNALIKLAKSEEKKSLGTLKPKEIIDFVIEPTEREWKKEWRDQLKQYNLFDRDETGQGKERKVIPKLPYKYSYKFLTEGDNKPRKLMIEDWELGALYWRSYYENGQDEVVANRQVRKRYAEEFLSRKELYFFMGTMQLHHFTSGSPFIIIGVFYPPKAEAHQTLMF